MKFAVITGISGGLGFDMARYLLESGIHVFGISRTNEETLFDIAKENNVTYIHYPCDLSVPEETAHTLEKIHYELEKLNENDHLYVINNAAVIHPIAPANIMAQKELTYHYQVNVLAPMQIMNTLLAKSMKQKCMLIGVNITSGAAENALFGWSAYCSAKASINMYTKTIALEQEKLQTGNKMISFNPGVMDTKMQEEIRSVDKENFLLVEQFKQYKQQGILSQTELVAGVLIDILTDEANITNGAVYDVNDYT